MNELKNLPFCIITTTILILLLTIGCRNTSYLSAYYQNKDKFTGREERDALYLVDLKDEAMLAKDLAALAREKAYSKVVYTFSDSATYDYKDFLTSLNLFAIKKQVKMPNAVSEKNHAVYDAVFEVKSQDEFDKAYLDTISNTLSEIVEGMEDYLKNGEDDSLKDFIAKNVILFKEQQKKVNRLIEKVVQ